MEESIWENQLSESEKSVRESLKDHVTALLSDNPSDDDYEHCLNIMRQAKLGEAFFEEVRESLKNHVTALLSDNPSDDDYEHCLNIMRQAELGKAFFDETITKHKKFKEFIQNKVPPSQQHQQLSPAGMFTLAIQATTVLPNGLGSAFSNAIGGASPPGPSSSTSLATASTDFLSGGAGQPFVQPTAHFGGALRSSTYASSTPFSVQGDPTSVNHLSSNQSLPGTPVSSDPDFAFLSEGLNQSASADKTSFSPLSSSDPNVAAPPLSTTEVTPMVIVQSRDKLSQFKNLYDVNPDVKTTVESAKRHIAILQTQRGTLSELTEEDSATANDILKKKIPLWEKKLRGLDKKVELVQQKYNDIEPSKVDNLASFQEQRQAVSDIAKTFESESDVSVTSTASALEAEKNTELVSKLSDVIDKAMDKTIVLPTIDFNTRSSDLSGTKKQLSQSIDDMKALIDAVNGLSELEKSKIKDKVSELTKKKNDLEKQQKTLDSLDTHIKAIDEFAPKNNGMPVSIENMNREQLNAFEGDINRQFSPVTYVTGMSKPATPVSSPGSESEVLESSYKNEIYARRIQLDRNLEIQTKREQKAEINAFKDKLRSSFNLTVLNDQINTLPPDDILDPAEEERYKGMVREAVWKLQVSQIPGLKFDEPHTSMDLSDVSDEHLTSTINSPPTNAVALVKQNFNDFKNVLNKSVTAEKTRRKAIDSLAQEDLKQVANLPKDSTDLSKNSPDPYQQLEKHMTTPR